MDGSNPASCGRVKSGHQETASIHALSGRIRLRLSGRSVELAAGQLLVIAPQLPHDVEPAEDGAFLLTLARGDS